MSNEPSPAPRVNARAVLAALAEIRRCGHWPLFQQLERDEPDLTEHVLEEVSHVHQTLLKSGAPPKIVRRLQRQIQSLVLATVLSVRASHRQPFGDESPDFPTSKGES